MVGNQSLSDGQRWHLFAVLCLVPVRHLPRLSRSMHFGDVSETNGWETTRLDTHRPRTIMRSRDLGNAVLTISDKSSDALV